MIRNGRLPKPEKYQPTTTLPFDLNNTLRHISHLAKRPRFTGSRALEDGMHYIMQELRQVAPIAKQNNLHLDLELTSSDPGSYVMHLGKYAKILNSYDKIFNVIARLRPAQLPYHTSVKPLLINTHVDSAVSSPGVSDILSGVGIAMELIRCISVLPPSVNALQRPIIFLFNGAEELGLVGAHAFVTQHAWGRSPAAFINIESIGAGNAYHLFRVGPNNPWLGHAFARAVSYPTGSVAATDIFNTKVRDISPGYVPRYPQ